MALETAHFGVNPKCHVDRGDVVFVDGMSRFDPFERPFGVAICQPIQIAKRECNRHSRIGFLGKFIGFAQCLDGGVPVSDLEIHAKRRFVDPSGMWQDFGGQG